MNTATKNLENDHVYILRLIDVMEEMVKVQTTDLKHVKMVVNLIEQFADSFHHAKEENLFFPLLLKKGISNEHGPISVMLHDHDEGRRFTKGMRSGITDYELNGETVFPKIYRNMQAYCDLLRTHIGKENNVLFKMADRLLSSTEQDHLLRAFKGVEANEFGNEQIDKYILDIEALEVIYKG